MDHFLLSVFSWVKEVRSIYCMLEIHIHIHVGMYIMVILSNELFVAMLYFKQPYKILIIMSYIHFSNISLLLSEKKNYHKLNTLNEKLFDQIYFILLCTLYFYIQFVNLIEFEVQEIITSSESNNLYFCSFLFQYLVY